MNFRKRLIAVVTFLGGLYFFLDFILPQKLPEYLGGYEFSRYNQQISSGFIAIGSVAFALGLINLLYIHGTKIVFKRQGALNSAALLLSLITMIVFTVNEWMAFEGVNSHAGKLRNLSEFARQIKNDAESKRLTEKTPLERVAILVEATDDALADTEKALNTSPVLVPVIIRDEIINRTTKATEPLNILRTISDDSEKSKILEPLEVMAGELIALAGERQKLEELAYKKSVSKALYGFVYEGLFVPLGSAMFALLGFYIISAGYRAFRVKSAESALMMIAAVVVMLGQIPFYSYIHESLPELRLWLLEVPSAAAFRAIKFGAAIAGLYMAIRMWCSIESTSFSDDGKGEI